MVEELKYMTENVYPLDMCSFNHFQSLFMGRKRKTATNSFWNAFTPDKGFTPDIDIFPLKVSLTQERKGQLEELYELK